MMKSLLCKLSVSLLFPNRSNKLVDDLDFQNALAAILEVLPVSSTFTGFEAEKGDVAEAAQDFEVLENIRRLLFSEKVPQAKQLELWLKL